MSRSAWARLRQTRRLPVVPLAAGACGLAGLLLGLGVGQMLDAPPGTMAGPIAIASGIALAIAAVLVLRTLDRSGASGLEKHRGSPAASTRDAIEHALAAPGCALAYSVSTIARAGVIDHLVATPVRLWVIAAIDRRVSREELPNVLAEIADNTTVVWDWAPQGTPVRGCLVLGGERRPARTQFDYGKGPVAVHTSATLARELKAEAQLPREFDERVANAVAELGPVSG